LAAVAILALPSAWLGWNYRVVAARRAELAALAEDGVGGEWFDPAPDDPNWWPANLTPVRRWLGDCVVGSLGLQETGYTHERLARIRALFPEAHISSDEENSKPTAEWPAPQ
jgi:hypothetical protein